MSITPLILFLIRIRCTRQIHRPAVSNQFQTESIQLTTGERLTTACVWKVCLEQLETAQRCNHHHDDHAAGGGGGAVARSVFSTDAASGLTLF